ncbi:hypothetical protein AAF712_016660 [Marasmius tenuissimus]|uniref:Uncharacterized protein n=1 Tax=Marasmius tenuissimus TaxID=585030 RepID=A0ABR2Z7A7_9AGAR
MYWSKVPGTSFVVYLDLQVARHHAKKYILALDVTKETKSSRQGGILKKKGRGKKAKSMVEMEEGKAKFLAEAWCYTAVLNQYYGNSPSDMALGDCREANRTVFCSLCATRFNKPLVFDPDKSTFTWLPVVTRSTKKAQQQKSKFNLGKKEQEVNWRWLIMFREFIWSEMEPLDPAFSNYPIAWFFPDILINDILEHFLRIGILADLEAILTRHLWRFADKKALLLFKLVTEFQEHVQWEREEEEMERKKKKTRAKVKKSAVSDEETEASNVDEVLENETADRSPSPSPPLKITIPPLQSLQQNLFGQAHQPQCTRQAQPSAAEYSASFGPPKSKQR